MSDSSSVTVAQRIGPIAALGLAACFLVPTPLPAEPPGGTAIVAEICGDEHDAASRYRAFSRKALEEGNTAVAHFFHALAQSESVHARNFLQLLAREGAPAPSPGDPKVGSTRKNLQFAIGAELHEIDATYPAHVARLRELNREEAARLAMWAWDSEKQHRDLITQMEKGTGVFFGVLEKTLKNRGLRYFVCHVCGSTYVELPEEACPICLSPHGTYEEVAPPAAATARPDPTPDRR